jgi:two-component system, OmpR family, osmolarity sensor histidine kinase EnvZ
MRALLKSWLPRSLYGRAALILLLPVILLQVIVSIAFIQRHYEGVTRQMVLNLAPGIAEVVASVNAAPDLPTGLQRSRALLDAFGLVATAGGGVSADRRAVLDIAAPTLIETLRNSVPDVISVDLTTNRRLVDLVVATDHGPMRLTFSRRLVTASNPHQLLVIMAFASILLTLISFIYLRNQLRPIRQLGRAAEAFGHGQTVRLKPTGALEVRAAGMAFLDMQDRIERQMEQRTMMLSGVSHDLRTPLTRMRLGLSLIDDPEAKPLLRDVDDMERLIGEFLDFARGDALDAVNEVDPRSLALDLMSRFPADKVTLAEAPGGVKTTLRPVAIARALGNLISNALRYGTRAEVSVLATPGALVFRVEDDGPGIPPDQREAALKPFVRLDVARNQDQGTGTGLGLAIAADIARSHGGVLRLGESARLGGLMADIVLPQSQQEVSV